MYFAFERRFLSAKRSLQSHPPSYVERPQGRPHTSMTNTKAPLRNQRCFFCHSTQKGKNMTETTKNVSIKKINSNEPAVTVALQPGVTVADVLREIGLGSSGFVLVDPNNPDAVFRGSDNFFAAATDGNLYAATAMVDAGRQAA